MYKDKGTGRHRRDQAKGTRRSGMYKDEGAGLDDMFEGGGAGLDDIFEDEGAGLDDMYEDEGVGQEKVVRRIKRGGKRATRWVKVNMGGEELDLYCNTGSNITIITPAMYRRSMGKVAAAKSYLRAWGSSEYLDTKGMFKTTLTTASGASKRTWVYVVAGARPEPLLGDHNTEDLGIISFNPEGRSPRGSDEEGEIFEDVRNVSHVSGEKNPCDYGSRAGCPPQKEPIALHCSYIATSCPITTHCSATSNVTSATSAQPQLLT